jgi:hypothetical protein
MGAIVVGIYMFMLNQAPKYQGVSAAGTPVKSSAAKVQAQPGTDMKTFKAESDRKVHGYGWVDESRGIVYVPIDKAIEMTANENLPHRQEESQ